LLICVITCPRKGIFLKMTIRRWTAVFLFLLSGVFLGPKVPVSSLNLQEQPTPTELVNAVNNLRLSRGLNALNVDPILSQTAQSQADALLASEGAVGHDRPNGITFTQQLLMLGYPLSGDLSQGGYRSENYIMGNGMTVQQVIEIWLGDEPHTNTMISPHRSDIGAGVAIASDGTVYYVIDTALRTQSGRPQAVATRYFPTGIATTGTPGTQQALISQYIVPIAVSTARPDGDVFHKVQYGQSLWAIANQYGTTVGQIQRLNNLGDKTSLNVGQLLLVCRNATQPAPLPTTTATFLVVIKTPSTPTRMQAATPVAFPTATGFPFYQSQTDGQNDMIIMGIVVVFLIIGSYAFTQWLRGKS